MNRSAGYDLLLRNLLLHIPADYRWTDAGIVRIGVARDIAAYAIGDFRGKCLIFCHGNGETAVSERYWFEQLAKAGVPEICPDYCGSRSPWRTSGSCPLMARDIATSRISSARSMCLCLSTSYKGTDGKQDRGCLIFGHKERISGMEGLWHVFCYQVLRWRIASR